MKKKTDGKNLIYYLAFRKEVEKSLHFMRDIWCQGLPVSDTGTLDDRLPRWQLHSEIDYPMDKTEDSLLKNQPPFPSCLPLENGKGYQ